MVNEAGKILPSNIEAEQSVLGAIMIDDSAFAKSLKILSHDDFYKKAHSIIFLAMQTLHQKKEPIDLVTLSAFLTAIDELQIIGGSPYLCALASQIPTSANISYHAKIVKEASQKRQVIKACFALAENIYQDNNINAEISRHRAELNNILTSSSQSLISMSQIASKVQNFIETRSKHTDNLYGITSGFADIDNLTDGFQRGDLIIIGGRPSMGKSCFAMNIIENCNVPAGVISLEMTDTQMGIRTLASLCGVNINSLRKGFIRREEWNDIAEATSRMANMPVHFSFTARRTADIERRIIELIEDKKVEIIVIDYLQLVRGDSTRQREREIADISIMLKGMAVDCQIPIIALAQLNRDVERRENKRPIMADLRESGSLEQDADIIAFLYRDEYYNKNSEDKGVAEIIIAKGRNIGTDVIKLNFFADRMKFENLYRGGCDVR